MRDCGLDHNIYNISRNFVALHDLVSSLFLQEQEKSGIQLYPI
jgi:hypothetical protein